MTFAYTVTCEIEDETLFGSWVAWLLDEHIAEVCAAGALDAEVIVLDGTPATAEVRYHFESRAAFERYERHDAPRLRAGGLKRIPDGKTVCFRRRTGEVRGAFARV